MLSNIFLLMVFSFYSNACSHNQEHESEEPVEIKDSNIKGAGKGGLP